MVFISTKMVTERISSQSLVGGAVGGVVAWVFGYVATYTVVAPDVRDSPLNRIIEAFNGEPATYEMVGWVFYNAHFVDTVFREVPLFGTLTTSFIGGDDGFTVLLFGIPIVALLASGVALAVITQATDAVQGGLAGAMVVLGYLVMTVAGVFMVRVTVGGASGAPDLLPALFLAGFMWPVVFGGIGGAVTGFLVSRRRDTNAVHGGA